MRTQLVSWVLLAAMVVGWNFAATTRAARAPAHDLATLAVSEDEMPPRGEEAIVPVCGRHHRGYTAFYAAPAVTYRAFYAAPVCPGPVCPAPACCPGGVSATYYTPDYSVGFTPGYTVGYPMFW